MQYVRLSVPQHLYNKLGLCPNKTLVLRNSQDICRPDTLVSTSNSSEASRHCNESVLTVPEINESSVDDGKNGSMSKNLIPSLEKCDGTSEVVYVNGNDSNKASTGSRITYPRKCTRCDKINNTKSAYFKHRRNCKHVIANKPDELVKPSEPVKPISEQSRKVAVVRYYEYDNDDYSDSFDDLDDEELRALSEANEELQEVDEIAPQSSTPKNTNTDEGDTSNTENIKKICRRICMNCCRSYCSKFSFKRHLKFCEKFKKLGPFKKHSGGKKLKVDSDGSDQESVEDKPVKWFPVKENPTKALKYFVVKKPPS